ncbi:MAG: 30S ribosomal protein S21 [Myxococcales bacterium]
MESHVETIGEAIEARPIEVEVDGQRLDRAIRKLKRRMAREGVARDLREHRSYAKPSIKKREKRLRAARRRARAARKRQQRSQS